MSVHPTMHIVEQDMVDLARDAAEIARAEHRAIADAARRAADDAARRLLATRFVTRRAFERCLGEVIREVRRREVTPLVERIAQLEARMVKQQIERGGLTEREWLGFCER